jgi:hypothetical protein
LLQLLLGGDTEVNKTICDLVATTVRELDEKEHGILSDEIKAFALTLNPHEQRAATISAIRLLGTLGRPQARKWLIGFVGSEHHHDGERLEYEEFVEGVNLMGMPKARARTVLNQPCRS